MKKILLIMICSMAAFATSCSLEETPYSITSEKLGQTEEGAEQLVTGIYATFWDNWCMEQTYGLDGLRQRSLWGSSLGTQFCR